MPLLQVKLTVTLPLAELLELDTEELLVVTEELDERELDDELIRLEELEDTDELELLELLLTRLLELLSVVKVIA